MSKKEGKRIHILEKWHQMHDIVEDHDFLQNKINDFL
jgi:hypothetical protein